MISAKSEWQMAFRGVICNGFGDLLADFRDQSWLLDNSDRRVVRRRKVLKLVVTIENDLPAELSDLVYQTRFDEPDCTFVHTRTRLRFVS